MTSWATSTVGDQFQVQLGKMLDAAKNIGEPKLYLGNRSVQWGRFDLSSVGLVPLTTSEIRRFRLRRGDLLVCEGGEVGRSAIWQDDLTECYFQKALHRLRPKADLDVRFMQALLEHWSSVSKFFDFVTQTSIAHLPRDQFIRMPLPVPSPSEQQKICESLANADRLLAKLSQLASKKRALRQGLAQQLLTGRTRLPTYGKEWENRRVKEMGTVVAGKALNSSGPGIKRPYLRTKNVLDGRIDISDVLEMPMTDAEFKRFSIVRDDVLLNEGQSLGLVGRCSVYRDDLGTPCAMQNQLLRFRAFEWTAPGFANHLFRNCQASGVFASIATQTTSVAHLGRSRFGNLRLLWPTDRREQVEIAEILDDSDRELALLESRLAKARVIKQGMMQQLLTGRTRLPVDSIT